MKYSIIDIGSNSMRLTVYEVENDAYKILFKEKIMAGLAGYVENGCISEEGIRRAYKGLLNFKNTLELLGMSERVSVFATASLRNIINTDEAVAKITAATGYDIDVITGDEETLLSYAGAMQELSVTNGVFIDVGGASTEIAVFADRSLSFLKSYRIGSLKLYKECVKNILPGPASVKKIKNTIALEMPKAAFEGFAPQEQLVCTGGTARSVLKIAGYLNLVPEQSNVIPAQDLEEIKKVLLGDQKTAANTILKIDPERIHTIIPGFLILRYIAKRFEVKKIIVSNYGVKEGYLCQKVLC